VSKVFGKRLHGHLVALVMSDLIGLVFDIAIFVLKRDVKLKLTPMVANAVVHYMR